MTSRTPRTLCHLLTIMSPRQRGGLQLSQATQTAASAAAMSGLPADACWHFCKVAGCQQTKCVNLAFGCSTGLRFTAVPTAGLWYCWRAWSGSVTGPPHVYMRCTLWVALKAFWWSELVPSQTPHAGTVGSGRFFGSVSETIRLDTLCGQVMLHKHAATGLTAYLLTLGHSFMAWEHGASVIRRQLGCP